MQDIINKYPELRDLLGKTEKSEEFVAIISQMSGDDLVRLQNYIGKRLKECEYELWKTDMKLRNINGQVQQLKEDHLRVSTAADIIKQDLQSIFKSLFKNPENAKKKCEKIEQRHGFNKAAQILHENPEQFGQLKGFKLPFNIRIGRLSRDVRENFAKRYYMLSRELDDAGKIIKWLHNMLREA